jgi:hypothetical protein
MCGVRVVEHARTIREFFIGLLDNFLKVMKTGRGGGDQRFLAKRVSVDGGAFVCGLRDRYSVDRSLIAFRAEKRGDS